MDRRVPHPSLFTGLAAFVFLIASHALAAPKDNAALKLDDDAIFTDYLATKFTDAERKLKQAVTICGRNNCSPSVLAQVRRDLGIVYVVTGRADEARAQFGEALRLDPATQIPKDLSTPEIQQVFASAGGAGGGGGRTPRAAAPEPEAGPAPVTSAPPGPDEEEEIEHVAVGEAALYTPLVIFAEMADGINPSKVQVRYKVFGSPDWKRLELKKYRRGYGAEIPCADIGSTPGEMRYYIQALGPSGEVIATNGTRQAPHRVILKDDPADEPRHLPGKDIPAKCKGGMQVDCPPGLPGCGSDRKKAPGSDCGADNECAAGVCLNGMCGGDPDKVYSESKCEADADCGTGKVCKEGLCQVVQKKNWLGLAAQQDVLMLPSTTGVCGESTDYVCFQNGGYYDPTQYPIISEAGDEIKGGFAASTTRILLSYDRTLGTHIGLGARVGYAFGGGPATPEGKSFFPAHIEARVSYWFGKNPFASTSIRPYVVLGGGVAQFDAKVNVDVYERPVPSSPDPDACDGSTCKYSVVAWKKAGTSFVAGGAGLMVPIDFKSGIVAEAKLMQAFSASALGASFQLGYQMGL